MKEILARWRYRRNWREFVDLMRRQAARGNIHALAELRRLKPDPDPWREQSLRAAVAIRLMFLPNEDCDPTQVIGDAELGQLVKDKLGTWQAGVWDGKKGCPKLTVEGLFPRDPTVALNWAAHRPETISLY